MLKINDLYINSALKPGSDTWFIPHISLSRWAQLIDWYLGLQITKSHLRKNKDYHPELKKIILENKLDYIRDFKRVTNINLLIPTLGALPTLYVCEVNEKSLDTWLIACLNVSKNLNLKNLRFFLPKSVDRETFRITLKNINPSMVFSQIDIVTDLE